MARADVLEQYVEHGKQAQRSPGGRMACFGRRVVRNAGYYLTLADGSPLSFTALWEHWDPGGVPLETFSIISTASSPGLEDIHHRQPTIIERRWFKEWLDPRTPLSALLELAREPQDGPFERRAVSARVNLVRNDDPDILLPVSESGLF